MMCSVSEDAGPDENHAGVIGSTHYNVIVSSEKTTETYYKDIKHGYTIHVEFSFSELQ